MLITTVDAFKELVAYKVKLKEKNKGNDYFFEDKQNSAFFFYQIEKYYFKNEFSL